MSVKGYRDSGQKSVGGWLKIQLKAALLVPAFFIVVSMNAVFSAVVGAIIALLATVLQANMVFRPYRAREPKAILDSMLGSEILKLLVVGLLFALVFKGLDWIEFIPLMTGFIVVYLTPNMAALIGRPRNNKTY